MSITHPWVFIALLLWVTLPACQTETRVPSELIGTWTTNNTKYKGLSFEITGSSITVWTAEGGNEIYAISKFEKVGRGNQLAYTFYGDRDGQQQQFAFFYLPTAGGELRFKNQIQIQWTKAPGPSP